MNATSKAYKKLDDLWSEYIRKRAMVETHGCQRCKTWKTSWRELQAHHCFSRTNRTTRFDIRCGAGICGGCHRYVQNHDDANMALFRELIGSGELQRLYVLTNMTSKQAPVDRKMVEIYLKHLIKNIDGRA